MGAVFGCIALSFQSIKKSRDKKKAPHADEPQSQQLPPEVAVAESQSVKDAQQGLQDEHSATISPIEPSGKAEGAGTKEVQREVATAASLPVPTA